MVLVAFVAVRLRVLRRPEVVAFVDCRVVANQLVLVPDVPPYAVTKSEVVVASVAVRRVPFRRPEVVAFVDCSVVAKSAVEVALVEVEFVTSKFVEEALTILRFVIDEEALLTMRAPETERAVVEAYGKVEAEEEVAVKRSARRVPSKEAPPATERRAKGVVVPTPTFPVFMTVKSVEVAKAPVEEEMRKRVVGGSAWPEVVVELAAMER